MLTPTPTPTPSPSITWPYPRWIAHRGAGKLAPENTLAAFRIGAALGFRAFECDVKLSADGVPMLLHDATLERTTSGAGNAGQQTWSALSQLDAGAWHSRAFAGEPMPTLQAIAAYVRRNGFALNIEIKPTPGEELITGEAVGREAARLWAGDTLPPLLSSFRPEALQGARESANALPRALLLDTLWAGWMDVARALACVAIVSDHKLMNAEVCAGIHAAGMRALVYTVNDDETAARVLAAGVDGVITDAVDHFAPAA